MVLPINGQPIKITPSGFTPKGANSARRITYTRYRQAPPYDLATPYTSTLYKLGSCSAWGTGYDSRDISASSYGTNSPQTLQDIPPWTVEAAISVAFSKLRDNLSESGLLGNSILAEGRQSLSMIARRVGEAGRLVRAISSGNIPLLISTLRSLAISPPRELPWLGKGVIGRRYRHGPKGSRGIYVRERDIIESSQRSSQVIRRGGSFADAVLEVKFGWEPILSDIQTAMALLSNGPPSFKKIKGAGKISVGRPYSEVNSGTYLTQAGENGWVRVIMGCTANVRDADLFLANQAGLVNFASAAWEATPFSFVVDYFFNVAVVLDSLTWDWGVTLSNTYTHITSNTTRTTRRTYWASTDLNSRTAIGGDLFQQTIIDTLNSVNLRMPVPTFKRFSLGKDYSRVKTSLALLIQGLSKRK